MTFKRTFLLRPTSLLLLTALLLGLLQHVDAFTLTKLSTVSNRAHISNTFRCQATNRKGDRGDDEPEESIEGGDLGIPCLPPIGESSFSRNHDNEDGVIKLNGESKEIGHVGSKRFELQ